ncbi:MAG: ABC transporter substrate-binding protein, partial [Gemmatimonadaceae bacterium]
MRPEARRRLASAVATQSLGARAGDRDGFQSYILHGHLPLRRKGALLRIRRSQLLLLSCAAAACAGDSREHADSTGQLRDDFGVEVPEGTANSPARIVSLNPATTELLFAIGAGSRVVGRTHWDVWPDSAKLVPDLGPGLRPNVEAVLAKRPDLVIIYGSEENRAAVD